MQTIRKDCDCELMDKNELNDAKANMLTLLFVCDGLEFSICTKTQLLCVL